MTGYITYIEYSAGLTKGETKQDDVFNSPFRLGKVDANYTSSCVVEELKTTGVFTPAFGKVVTGAFDDNGVAKDLRVTDKDGNVTFYNAGDSITVNPEETVKVAYLYDNVVVPQGADKIPTIKAEMKSKSLLAKARRIAVYYSQIAAFQA